MVTQRYDRREMHFGIEFVGRGQTVLRINDVFEQVGKPFVKQHPVHYVGMNALHIRDSEVQLEFVTGISLLVGPAGINLVKPRRLMKFFLFVALEGVDVSYLRIELVVFQGDGAVLQDLVFGINFITALPRFRQRQVGAYGKPQQAVVGQTVVESQIKEQF